MSHTIPIASQGQSVRLFFSFALVVADSYTTSPLTVAVPVRGLISLFDLSLLSSFVTRELFLENDVAHEEEEVENIMIWPALFL